MTTRPKTEYRLCILDCVSGKRAVVNKTPFVVGSNAAADFRLDPQSCPPVLCIITTNGGVHDVRFNASSKAIIDGVAADSFSSRPGQEHSFVCHGQMLAFRHMDDAAQSWQETAVAPAWNIYDRNTLLWNGPFDTRGVRSYVNAMTEDDWSRLVLLPSGLDEMGFFMRDAKEALDLEPQDGGGDGHGGLLPSLHESQAINSEYGEFTCPVCWFKFDRGDVMNIAVHASLRGDPLLGENHMQRFHATRFNDRGQALDAMGVAAGDLACPHCRRKLPTGFLDLPHHVFSIVGAPSSGKSYYLSVLVKVLQNSLFQKFGITFRDADPSDNVILTQMKSQLFSASTPQEAFLAKTELEGALYETLPRQGRKVRLPKPFIFRLSHPQAPDSGFSVVFYDNAGEHFEPTSNSADSPGAQHIAVASGIFFLFDPLHNTEFRRRLNDVKDPQLNSHRLDHQDVILAETEVRIKSLLGLDSRERVATPLAVMVGKCDTWSLMLGREPLLPATVDGTVSQANIAANSKRIRSLLLEVCPAIVANAEVISSNVCYFAVSPLGCSPVEFKDGEGHVRIGPDPKKIDPRHVDAPTLWVLSQISPDIVPCEPTT
ncbi:hypothetical protein [Prosthecobacter sp.]|jgi:hypothetical protein|uniref:hypothetical protein n=1 Tax=Prosthecobacter sp. TaxID=1965333 RepID=UPI0025EB16DD|nr:hypothetical protein [Prosthecobacter sp.]